MFSCVGGDKHIGIKTPTHQINTKSHEAHEKNIRWKNVLQSGGKKRDVACRSGVFGGLGGITETQKECVKGEGVIESTGIT